MVLGTDAAVPSYLIGRLAAPDRVDETPDVLVHGTPACSGIIFIGFFARASWTDPRTPGRRPAGHQLLAVAVAPAYAFVATFFLIPKLVGAVRAASAPPGAKRSRRRPARRGSLRLRRSGASGSNRPEPGRND